MTHSTDSSLKSFASATLVLVLLGGLLSACEITCPPSTTQQQIRVAFFRDTTVLTAQAQRIAYVQGIGVGQRVPNIPATATTIALPFSQVSDSVGFVIMRQVRNNRLSSTDTTTRFQLDTLMLRYQRKVNLTCNLNLEVSGLQVVRTSFARVLVSKPSLDNNANEPNIRIFF